MPRCSESFPSIESALLNRHSIYQMFLLAFLLPIRRLLRWLCSLLTLASELRLIAGCALSIRSKSSLNLPNLIPLMKMF
jgi:hypothetical protein